MSNWLSRVMSGGAGKKREGSPSRPDVPAGSEVPSSWSAGGVILDEYLIEKELGRGGMGRVWLVRSQSTGRRFAVKQALIRDEKHRKAFLSELQTWIDLPEHPNIVPCRFFRTVGNEIVIFADYIESGSLADWIAKHKLTTVEQILDVAIQFAWGLHAIHERGLIHQDVKPGNVLMTPDGVPMVTDFGLARARLRAADGSFVSPALPPGQQSVLVSSGGMTPAYASPEQRAGQPLSRKTDIWSWGVSVLDMFMGGVSCPHGGHIAGEVLEAFVESGCMAEGLPMMPEGIVAVLHRCFSVDSARRDHDMKQVAQTVGAIYADSTGHEHARPSGGLRYGPDMFLHHDRRVKNTQWRDPREWLRAVHQALGISVTGITSDHSLTPPSRTGAGVADLAICEEAETLLRNAAVTGASSLRRLLADLCADKALIYLGLNDVNGAIKACEDSASIWEQLAKEDNTRHTMDGLAAAYMNKANILHAAGKLDDAYALYLRCTDIRERLSKSERSSELQAGLLTAYMNMASFAQSQGLSERALETYGRCIAAYENLVTTETRSEKRNELSEELAAAHNGQARALISLGRYPSALDAYDQCIAIRDQLVNLGQTHIVSYLADSCEAKGQAVARLGDFGKATTLIARSVELYERLVTGENRQEFAADLADAYMSKGIVVEQLGDFAAAISLYDECITISQPLVEQSGRLDLAPCLARACMNKAVACEKTGNIEASAASYDRCIASLERLSHGNRSDCQSLLASAYVGRGQLACRVGDSPTAIKAYDRGIALLEAEAPRRQCSDSLARAYRGKADALKATGNAKEALSLYDAAISIHSRLLEQRTDPEVANELAVAYVNKGNLLNALGNLQEAIEAHDQCIAIRKHLVEEEGRQELACDLALAYGNKAATMKKLGKLSEAVNLYNDVIRTCEMFSDHGRKQIYDQHRVWAQLSKASVLLEIGSMAAEERNRTREAFDFAVREAAKTGGEEYGRLAEWSRQALRPVLFDETPHTESGFCLPSGLRGYVSPEAAIVDFSKTTKWLRCPPGHFWFVTPNIAMSPPPYDPSDEVALEEVYAPVPKNREEAKEFVHVYIEDADHGLFWRGDWMDLFHESYPLSSEDKRAWLKWVSTKGAFLDGVMERASREAARAAAIKNVLQPAPFVRYSVVSATEIPTARTVHQVADRLYELSELMSRSYRLTSGMRQTDYETAVSAVGARLHDQGCRIVSAERDRNAPCSLIAETPRGSVGIKVTVVRAPDEPRHGQEDVKALRAFCAHKADLCAVAPVGLMPGTRRSPEGHQEFYVKFEGLINV